MSANIKTKNVCYYYTIDDSSTSEKNYVSVIYADVDCKDPISNTILNEIKEKIHELPDFIGKKLIIHTPYPEPWAYTIYNLVAKMSKALGSLYTTMCVFLTWLSSLFVTFKSSSSDRPDWHLGGKTFN